MKLFIGSYSIDGIPSDSHVFIEDAATKEIAKKALNNYLKKEYPDGNFAIDSVEEENDHIKKQLEDIVNGK